MNKVMLIGNITRTPEFAETQNGISVCKFTLAVNRPYTKGENKDADFFNIITWRGTAENVAKYCDKGSKLYVEGYLQIRNYEDKEGNKRTSVDINADTVEFLSRGKGNEGKGGETPAQRPTGKPKLEILDDDDDDIPF